MNTQETVDTLRALIEDGWRLADRLDKTFAALEAIDASLQARLTAIDRANGIAPEAVPKRAALELVKTDAGGA